MRHVSTIFLRGVILLLGIGAIAILIRLPLSEGRGAHLKLFSIYSDPFILYAYFASTPFFIALYKAFKLLGYIAGDKAFSADPIRALKSIKYCAFVLSILIMMAAIYIKLFHDKDDDPAGFLSMCIVMVFICIVVVSVVEVFEKILQKGIRLKFENEQPTDKINKS